MTKLYLVTGFLGAGKTTFLHEVLKLFSGRRCALIVNEFGRRGVDGALLADLGTDLTEINNGSIFCACKLEQFEAALLALQGRDPAPEFVFVEASGLSDPTAVGAILNRREVFPAMEYAGAICLVDALRFPKLCETARVCRMQLAVSDLVLVNKADLVSREQLDALEAALRAQRPDRPVHETAFGRVERAWLEEMHTACADPLQGEIHTRDLTLRKLTLRVSGLGRRDLTDFLRMVADETYRIKGFVTLPEGPFLVDCVGPLVELRPYDGPGAEWGALTVLYGNGLKAKRAIENAKAWFPKADVREEKEPPEA